MKFGSNKVHLFEEYFQCQNNSFLADFSAQSVSSFHRPATLLSRRKTQQNDAYSLPSACSCRFWSFFSHDIAWYWFSIVAPSARSLLGPGMITISLVYLHFLLAHAHLDHSRLSCSTWRSLPHRKRLVLDLARPQFLTSLPQHCSSRIFPRILHKSKPHALRAQIRSFQKFQLSNFR